MKQKSFKDPEAKTTIKHRITELKSSLRNMQKFQSLNILFNFNA